MEIPEDDLRRLYAKLNAQEVILRTILRLWLSTIGSDQFEPLRAAVMDTGDMLRRPVGDPNPDFTDQGRIETLMFLAETLEAVRLSEADGSE